MSGTPAGFGIFRHVYEKLFLGLICRFSRLSLYLAWKDLAKAIEEA